MNPDSVAQSPKADQLRIALVSPRGPLYRRTGGAWKKSLRYAPLTLTTLAALIPPELNAAVTLIDEGIEDIDLGLEADLIGISAITGTAPRAYELAAHFRGRGIPVVLGGVHPTLMPDEAQQHADSIVVGYAEETWPQLLHDFVAGRMAARYTQSPTLSLAGKPWPRRELLPRGQYVISQTIEATRGCIHHCEFCVVPTAWGGPLQKPVHEVIDEIRSMKTKRLLFLDLNLIADKDYAAELFTAMIPLRVQWGGLATTLIAWDEAFLDLTAASGCRGLLIGFETLSADALKETRKGFNQRTDYLEVARRLHDRGIAMQGTFVFGFDSHTEASFGETVDFIMEARIDLPRFAVLTPFPGTPLFARLKQDGRILTEDWTLYDGQHVVYEPARMAPDTLLRKTEWAWKSVYSYGSIFQRLRGVTTHWPLALAANLGYRFYAHRLHEYYTCDWKLAGLTPAVPT